MSGFVEKKELEKILLHLDDRLNSIKAIAESPYLDFNYSVSSVSVTLDGAWRDKTVASNAKLVLLSLYWDTPTPGHVCWFYTRKKGSGQTWEGIFYETSEYYDGKHGGLILQPCDDDGKYQYRGAKDSGTLTVQQIGYFYK